MADPTGIILKAKISQQAVNSFLNSKQPATENLANFTEDFQEYKTVKGEKTSRFLAALLYESNQYDNIFLFQYNEAKAELFFAFILNFDYPGYLNALLTIVKHLSTFIDHAGKNEVFLMSPTSGDVYAQYSLQVNSFEVCKTISHDVAKDYTDTFWSFHDKKLQAFPEAEKAIKKRNYFYKPIIAAYKKYVAYIEEQLKPQKIKEATKENPFKLIDNLSGFCSYDGKVYCRDYYKAGAYYENLPMQMVECELQGADPYTFRHVAHDYYYADKNHLYQRAGRQADGRLFIYEPVEGIDGATFTYIGNKHEHVYYKDKNHIYYELKAMPADVKTFKDLNFGFGKDKQHVFFCGEIIPINAQECSIDKHGFLRDKTNVFHCKTKVPLDGATFKVVQWESDVNPFIGTFILEDKNGRYEFVSNPKEETAKIKKI